MCILQNSGSSTTVGLLYNITYPIYLYFDNIYPHQGSIRNNHICFINQQIYFEHSQSNYTQIYFVGILREKPTEKIKCLIDYLEFFQYNFSLIVLQYYEMYVRNNYLENNVFIYFTCDYPQQDKN